METFTPYSKAKGFKTPLLDCLINLIENNPGIQKNELQAQCQSNSNIHKTIQTAIAMGKIKPDGNGGYIPLKPNNVGHQ
jgi:hypothetical protein